MRENVTPQLWEFNFHPGLYKIKTNVLMLTIDAVFAKLDTPLPLGYCNVSRIAEIGSSVQSNFMVGNRVVIPYLKAENVPVGSTLKGYEDYTVQGLVFRSHNTRYRRERWQTPEGEFIVAPLPQDVQALDGGHFDRPLISFILYQYYHAHVTQPLILEELLEMGVDISKGQVNRIITEGYDRFHREKDEILRAGLKVSGHVNVDDTGARYQGKNGYCIHIGNELFAWFQSTESKSRINFLKILRAEHKDYVLGSDAIEYMRANNLPRA